LNKEKKISNNGHSQTRDRKAAKSAASKYFFCSTYKNNLFQRGGAAFSQVISFNIFSQDTAYANEYQKFKLAEDFSVYACFKIAYPNSVIINPTPYKLKKDGRLPWSSTNTIGKKLKMLLERGWATREGERIILTPKKEFNKIEGAKKRLQYMKVKIKNRRKKNTFQQIKEAILQHLTASKVGQMEFARDASQTEIYGQKTLTRCVGKNVTLSFKGIANTLGYVSPSSSHKWLSKLTIPSLKKKKHKREYLGKVSMFRDNIQRGMFITRNGFVFLQPCTKYRTLQATKKETYKVSDPR
jgi:hypothetical protein